MATTDLSGEPRILALWSAPRSRSTAFLRMMDERGDRAVLHEPFSQLADFGVSRVGAVGGAGGVEVRSESALITAIRSAADARPVFFKDTTDFHYPGLLADGAFLRDAVHTFLIRSPGEVIASHYALNRDLRRDDVGIARLSEIHDAVAEAGGRPPVVVDSDDLIADPEATVRAYCAAVGIPFIAEALSWRAKTLPEWGSTLRWHEKTARTTGFVAAPPRPGALDEIAASPLLTGYLEFHRPYYEKLRRNRVRVGPGLP